MTVRTKDEALNYRTKLDALLKAAGDAAALAAAEVFPVWRAGTAYCADDRVRFGGLLYRCIQAHTTQGDWAPGAAESLWAAIADPEAEWPEWSQPSGTHDAYALNAGVSHNGRRWTSIVDTNIWEPGVYGWAEAE